MSSSIYVAFTDNFLVENPTWTKLSGVASWESHRGRSYELDRTETGTATIKLYDALGTYDPLGSGGVTSNIKPLRQIKIDATNPIDNSTTTQFRGFIEDWSFQIDQAQRLLTTTINCVDAFDIIAGVEVDPGSDGTADYAAQRVDDRIRAVLQDIAVEAGLIDWPPSWTNIFTGNVVVQGVKYQPGTESLTVLRDAADAEFPGVANIFIDKQGRVAFRGRLARLNYLAYVGTGDRSGSKPILTWNVGDSPAAQSTWAWISEIDWMIDKNKIINACLATPEGMNEWSVSGQLVTNSASIDIYGPRSQKFEGLLIRNRIGNATFIYETAAQDCKEIAQFYVLNYNTPLTRISRLVFRAQNPANTLYTGHWKFLLNVEIGDLLFVTTHDPGNGGFSNTGFFVEGIHCVVQPGAANYDWWEMSLDVAPQALYTYQPFGLTPQNQTITVVLAGATRPTSTSVFFSRPAG